MRKHVNTNSCLELLIERLQKITGAKKVTIVVQSEDDDSVSGTYTYIDDTDDTMKSGHFHIIKGERTCIDMNNR